MKWGKHVNKKLKVVLTLILLAALLSAYHFNHKSFETVYQPNQLIRLHIVANSDCTVDQELKRKIRDEIIHCFSPDLVNVPNIEAAREITRANLDRIKAIASREISAQGQNYPAEVQLGRFTFPTKHYGPFMLPAGEYESVQIIIGSGSGANWWCVLFPPLCFVDMPKAAAGIVPENINPGSIPPAPVEEVPVTGTAQEIYMPASESGREGAAAEDPIRVVFRFRIFDFYKNLFN